MKALTFSYLACGISMIFIANYAPNQSVMIVAAILALYFLAASIFKKTLIWKYDLEKPRTEDAIRDIMSVYPVAMVVFGGTGLPMLLLSLVSTNKSEIREFMVALGAFFTWFGITKYLHYKRWQKRFPNIVFFADSE